MTTLILSVYDFLLLAIAFLGVASGAICAPLNPAYREPEFEFYLTNLK